MQMLPFFGITLSMIIQQVWQLFWWKPVPQPRFQWWEPQLCWRLDHHVCHLRKQQPLSSDRLPALSTQLESAELASRAIQQLPEEVSAAGEVFGRLLGYSRSGETCKRHEQETRGEALGNSLLLRPAAEGFRLLGRGLAFMGKLVW